MKLSKSFLISVLTISSAGFLVATAIAGQKAIGVPPGQPPLQVEQTPKEVQQRALDATNSAQTGIAEQQKAVVEVKRKAALEALIQEKMLKDEAAKP